jgi:hypothetical protein
VVDSDYMPFERTALLSIYGASGIDESSVVSSAGSSFAVELLDTTSVKRDPRSRL